MGKHRGEGRDVCYALIHSHLLILKYFSIGWLFKVKLSDNSELDSLLDEAAYKEFCQAEEGH
jgi:hypothetical protein